MGHSTVTELSKFSINPDAFIYAVNQAFQARLKASGEFNSHLRFEPFLANTRTTPKVPELNQFKVLLGDIINHHFRVLPNFHRNENVDLENISWFSHSVATLFADLNFLLQQFTGSSLPEFSGSTIPKAVSSKNIVVALEKYSNYLAQEQQETPFSLFPLLNENNENIDQLYTQEIWSLISSFAKKTFGSYFSLLQSYILWKYTAKEAAAEVIDWHVRPPCGAAYERQFKELFDKEREERYAKRSERHKGKHDKDAGDRKKASSSQHQNLNGKKPQHEEQNHRSPSETHKQKFEFKEPKEKEQKFEFKEPKEKEQKFEFKEAREPKNHSERHPREPKQQFHTSPKGSYQNEQKQQQDLEVALEEAKQAIQKMIKNKSLNEFSLTPQNSFIRRQQHELITESGFETESLGEAKNRHVCIKRKQ